MRRIFEGLEGNNELKTRVFEDIRDGVLSHAYIIEGPKGSGKHTLAALTAAALACEKKDDTAADLPCLQCENCRKIMSRICPDVTYINRGDKAGIGVDVIRGLCADIYISPNELENKVYIIEEAHLMTPEAQNAFLKALEEPPARVLFLLLSERRENLLETVKSRAPTLRMSLIPRDQMEKYLLKTDRRARGLDKDSLEELVMESGGRIGAALASLSPKEQRQALAVRGDVKNFIAAACDPSGTAELPVLVRSFPTDRAALGDFLSDCESALCDIAAFKRNADAPEYFFADRDDVEKAASGVGMKTVLSFADSLSRAREAIYMNSNIQITLSALACEMSRRK